MTFRLYQSMPPAPIRVARPPPRPTTAPTTKAAPLSRPMDTVHYNRRDLIPGAFVYCCNCRSECIWTHWSAVRVEWDDDGPHRTCGPLSMCDRCCERSIATTQRNGLCVRMHVQPPC